MDASSPTDSPSGAGGASGSWGEEEGGVSNKTNKHRAQARHDEAVVPWYRTAHTTDDTLPADAVSSNMPIIRVDVPSDFFFLDGRLEGEAERAHGSAV